MASTKSRSAKQSSGSRKRPRTASSGKRSSRRTQASTRKQASAGKRRSGRRKAKQPSAMDKLVQAARSAKAPGIAAGAAASVIGGVAIVARRRKSHGFDARGLAKRIGRTTKNLGKTSQELGKEMQRLGDDAESVGKTLS